MSGAGLRVAYSRVWAVSFLVLGGLCAAINLVVANPMGLIPGIVCIVVGLGYLARPYFYLEGNQVVVPAVLGPLKKVYPFEPGQLVERDGALHLGEKKLGMRRWLADKRSWTELARFLETTKAFD